MGHHIKRFRCDNGTGEYNNRNFQSIQAARGIRYEPAPPYTQHKNGIAVRLESTFKYHGPSLLGESTTHALSNAFLCCVYDGTGLYQTPLANSLLRKFRLLYSPVPFLQRNLWVLYSVLETLAGNCWNLEGRGVGVGCRCCAYRRRRTYTVKYLDTVLVENSPQRSRQRGRELEFPRCGSSEIVRRGDAVERERGFEGQEQESQWCRYWLSDFTEKRCERTARGNLSGLYRYIGEPVEAYNFPT